ncbi:hypothetical protein WG622_11445 [Cognatishimia sp. D5M38]|uniref:Uncharacterized protein n=1 Tax=Cognatishimia coralii TaxID=3083254 RepID=A0ABU8QHF9_9RHOB
MFTKKKILVAATAALVVGAATAATAFGVDASSVVEMGTHDLSGALAFQSSNDFGSSVGLSVVDEEAYQDYASHEFMRKYANFWEHNDWPDICKVAICIPDWMDGYNAVTDENVSALQSAGNVGKITEDGDINDYPPHIRPLIETLQSSFSG